jgi:hypothetical protein
MRKLILLATALFGVGFQAHAACFTAASLDNENDNCLSNGKYVDAGITCFTGFEAAVKKQSVVTSKLLGASNQAHVGGDANAQKSGMAGSQADYQIANATLDALIAAGKAARASLVSYSKDVYYPEDWDAPSEVIGDPVAYLNNSPCYAEPRDMLQDMVSRTDGYLNDLENAKKAATAMRDLSRDRDQHLDQLPGSQRAPASAAKGQGSGSVRGSGGPASNGASSITGVGQDREKRGKQQ